MTCGQPAAIRDARGVDVGGGAAVLPALARLEEIPGISAGLAAPVIAETGPGMSRFPTASHWSAGPGHAPSAIQSGSRSRPGNSHGNSYLRGYRGQAATGAARTTTFPGERHQRTARHRGTPQARAAARPIPVITWHPPRDPQARSTGPGPGHHQTKINKGRPTRHHTRQLEAPGSTVTTTQAAQARPASHRRATTAGSTGAAARPLRSPISGLTFSLGGYMPLLCPRVTRATSSAGSR